MVVSLDGIVILYVDYDEFPGESRTGSLIMLLDVERGAIGRATSQQHSKETLSKVYSRIEKLYKEKNLRMETMVPIFKEYGLKQ